MSAPRGLVSRLREDRGAATVEWTMVASVVVLVGFSVIQVALFLHARNTLVDAAGTAARHGAIVGHGLPEAERHAGDLVDSALGTGYPAQVEARRTVAADGAVLVRVEISGQIPFIGLLGPAGSLTVTGHALDENALP